MFVSDLESMEYINQFTPWLFQSTLYAAGMANYLGNLIFFSSQFADFLEQTT